jgi:quinoprotein glucose dehydrogenase
MKNGSVLVPLLKDKDPEIRAQAAKWLGDVRYKDAGASLIQLLKDDYSRARFFAAEALGRIAYTPAVDQIVALLESNNDKDIYIRHAASLALARIGDEGKVVALSKHPSRAVRLGAVVALRRMRNAGIAQFLNDNDEFVVTEAARGINDDLSIEGALAPLGNILNSTRFKNEPLIRRAINANLRVGSQDAMRNLLQYAAKDGNPVAMRSEAIAALSTWAKPSVVDRVDGRYRGEIKRDLKGVQGLAGKDLLALAASTNSEVRLSAVRAIGKLQIAEGSDQLFSILKTDKDAIVREEALRSMSMLSDKKMAEAIKIALQDDKKNVRVTALDLLPKMNLSQDLMVSLLDDVIATKTVEEKQAAFVTLGTIPAQKSKPSFEKFLTQLEAKKLPSEVLLELSEAIDKTGDVSLKERLKSITQKTTTDTLKAAYAGALLGGSPDRGAQIFYGHQSAQCIRCHSYGDYGGNAGPRLNGVATRLSREQILEAVINPSARIAPGYGTATVELKGGRKVSGIVQEDKAGYVKLRIGSKPDTVIKQESIVNKVYGPSSMPPMRTILTKKEIRDVVSFLATLKE